MKYFPCLPRAARQIAMLAACLAMAANAAAQGAWPTQKPVTLIVPYTAGGAVDATARLLAQKLSAKIGQSVVIENVAGAGGAIGVGKAAQAAPDGYTLLMGADSPIAIAGLVNPAAVRYDAAKDLTPVALVTTTPMVLVGRPTLAANNLQDVLRLAREQPGKLSYATSGVGTVLQLAMEMLKQRTGVHITHIPYRGGAQIANDVIGGQVDLAMMISITAAPHVASGKMKAFGVTTAERSAALPGVPAMGELPALKGFSMAAWSGVFTRAGTPPAIVERLNRDINEILRQDDVKATMAQQGAIAGSGSPAAFSAFVAGDLERFGRIVRQANIRE